MAHAPWHRAFASLARPAHKSDMTRIVGDYGCPRQFQYEMNAREAGIEDERDTVSGKAAAGTATHEVIARVLSSRPAVDALLAGKRVPREQLAKALSDEYEREVGGRAAQWYRGEDAIDVLDERLEMIYGLLHDLHRYVADVVLVEPGFIAPLGDYWLSGHLDMLYRPRSNPTRLAIADWKTGASKPAQIELDHGWEAGIYSAAVRFGGWLSRESLVSTQRADGRWTVVCGARECTHASRYIAERRAMEAALIDIGHDMFERDAAASDDVDDSAVTFGEWPVEVHHVHLADYVPYRKAGTKAVKRPEDVAFYELPGPDPKFKYTAGMRRGPAWLPVALTEHDVPRITARLRNIVGMVRMGWFVDQVGERCTRCQYASECLTSGYAPTGNEHRRLERALEQTTAAHDAAELSIDDD